MGGVVKGMDKVLASMDVDKVERHYGAAKSDPFFTDIQDDGQV